MKTKQEKKIPAIISISAKCSDLCFAQIQTKEREEIFTHDGYVPEFMPGEHYGDYVILDIELATGKILNWKKPNQKTIKDFIKTGH